MKSIYEGFDSFVSLLETEFVEERLFAHQYKLDCKSFRQIFGDLARILDYYDLPSFLQYSVEKEYFEITHEFNKFIFSREENSEFLFLEYSYTDGLEYIRSDLFTSERIIA